MLTRLVFTLLLNTSLLSFGKLNADQAAALHQKLSKEADIQVGYHNNDTGEIFQVPPKKKLPFDTAKEFFVAQKNKKLIVVTLAKTSTDGPEYQKKLLKIRDFLIACGYQRVAIFQANSGGPPISKLDHTAPKK